LGVNGKGKAPHWRLTEVGYMHEPPTKDFLKWDGEMFHEQKSPEYYKRQERRIAKLRRAKNRIPHQPTVQTAPAHGAYHCTKGRSSYRKRCTSPRCI
jgi:hypothetical protein